MTAVAGATLATDPLVPRAFRVRRTRRETDDTSTLYLEPANGEPLAFRAGQFTMIGRPGHGEVPISISGDPANPEVLEHTVRAVGDSTRALVAAEPGDVVLVRGPYGRGWELVDGAGGDVVLVAGGIGLAPLRPVVLELLANRDRFGKVVIVYGSRTPDQLLFPDELAQWRGRFDIDVDVTVDVGTTHWRGHVGLVTSLLVNRDLDPANALAMTCGPEIMMRLTAEALVGLGLGPDRVRVSMERNMKCGIGLCGHCQIREQFVCVDGPVVGYDVAAPLMQVRGL